MGLTQLLPPGCIFVIFEYFQIKDGFTSKVTNNSWISYVGSTSYVLVCAPMLHHSFVRIGPTLTAACGFPTSVESALKTVDGVPQLPQNLSASESGALHILHSFDCFSMIASLSSSVQTSSIEIRKLGLNAPPF